MIRRFGSLRLRLAASAALIVAFALVISALALLFVLNGDLTRRAELSGEVKARQMADLLESGRPPQSLPLGDDDESPVRIVGPQGTLAESEGLEGQDPGFTFAPPSEWAGSGAAKTRTVRWDHDDTLLVAVPGRLPDGQVVTVFVGVSLRDPQDTLETLAKAMLIVGGLLVCVVAGVAWGVTHRVLRPVEAIRSEFAEITSTAELSRRVPLPASRDEIGSLAQTVNDTLAELEASSERQRRFIADASHELRNPIAAIRAELDVAEAHPELLDLPGLREEVVRLQTLATDLLLLARLDAGEPTRPAPTDLGDLAHRQVALRNDRLPVKVTASDGVTVMGNHARLARVLANLLDNAQRHGSSRVEVRVHADDEWAVLEVRDDGPGIQAADRGRVFDRFTRLDDARTRDDGGAGLGLAIVRETVNSHEGTVRLEDAAPGLAVVVRLPRVSEA